ncbi:MAG TPA: pseudouridine-5'-phosphate glycosidase [Magnetospirillaceae bacterium]|jgi:pseudouridine-5'-phosphate glycosidase
MSNSPANLPFVFNPEVEAALNAKRAVVALESTIISHGLPHGRNLEVAHEIEATVRGAGAIPATIAIIDGSIRVGLSTEELAQIADGNKVAKASIRDLPIVLAKKTLGATTVASTSFVAARAGIKVFATGGLGGVHRDANETYDESADLTALSQSPIAVVCAGVKSILDISATLERLETLSVGVIGYGTDRFPGFYVRSTEHKLPWRLDTPADIAAALKARDALGLQQAIVVANPIPANSAMDQARHDRILAEALHAMAEKNVSGKNVTPFLLAFFHERTQGESLSANVALVLNNAALAAQIAVAAAK